MGKKKNADAPDSDEEWEQEKAAVQRWTDGNDADDADEGSSDDEADVQKQQLLSKQVLNDVPIHRVLTKATKRGQIVAYAVLSDLGSGVVGFSPLSELASGYEARNALSLRLPSIRPLPPPRPGRPDKRARIRRVVVEREAQGKNQLFVSALGNKVCEALKHGWGSVAPHCREFLQHLYDRDRVGDLSSLHGLHIGLLLEADVQHRTNDGLVAELHNPFNPKQGQLVGVAVGANAVLPAEGGNVAMANKGTQKKFLQSSLKCRVLDFDLSTGFIDITTNPLICACPAARDPNAAQNAFKAMKKRAGAEVPLTVLLKKATHAVVLCGQYDGVLGYLPFRDEAEAAKINPGDKIKAKVSFVRVRPALQKPKKKKDPSAHWTQVGRRMMDDDDDDESAPGTPRTPGTPGSVTSAGTATSTGSRVGEKAPLDPWLCPESFAVFSYVPPALRKDDARPDPLSMPAPPEQLLAEEPEKPAAAPTPAPVAAPEKPATPAATAAAEKAKKKKADASPEAPPAKKAKKAAAAAEEEMEDAAAPAAPRTSLADMVKVAPKKVDTDPLEVGFAFREEGGDEEEGGKLSKAEKKKLKKQRAKEEEVNELLVDEVERRKLRGDEPQTVDDFERLVMGSPHSSYVWCQYIAFLMAQRELEQARLTAERALKTIDYREVEELYNVWVAFLNLENLHGTPDSLHAVFMRFVQHSDEPEKAYEALVQIGKSTGHHILVEKTYQSMLKKFGQKSNKPWVDYVEYLLARGKQDEVTKLQKRILNNDALTDKQHVEILIKIGCLQYRKASIDKGRTIFEGLVAKYPKRTDIWSVYLDMEQVVLPRLEDLTRIRHVFDRVTSMPLSSKKMQFFMTRYMAFEKQHGTADRVEYVKKRAIDFVNAKLGEAEA